ncbi:hypothetical protein [Microbispora sp. NPDC046933]|uniref:hypothetical protein n=1 Tax=Microbispora sp. NPDC046933 TaxID=3155618 RepID=UPI0033C920BF
MDHIALVVLAAVVFDHLAFAMRLRARGRRRPGPAEEPQPGRLADQRATRAAVGGPL